MTTTTVLKAIALASDTPCARYSCRMRQRCADELLACDAWNYYVEVGTAVNPQMQIPARITKQDRPYMGDQIIATREKFMAEKTE